MNILLFHPHDIYSDFEPWTVRITYIASCLVKLGHKVTLVYFPLDSINIPKEKTQDGMRIVALSRKANPYILLRNIKDICKLLEDIDVVHFQKCFHFCSVPVALSSWIKNVPIHYDWDDWETKIYYMGGEPASRFTGLFLRTLEYIMPKLADTVSVASQKLKELAIARGVPEDRIYIAPVGADLDKFNPNVDGSIVRKRFGIQGPIVLYAGQLHGGQYAYLFLHAAKVIIENHKEPHITFIIAGGGHNEEALRKMGDDLGLSNNLMITGLMPHDEIPFFMAAADICVACFEDNDITISKSPLKIAEYMASGKTIVASDVGEVKTMLKGAGSVVEAGNHEALVGEILRFLPQPTLREHMGKKARKRAEEVYNWETTTNTMVDAYHKALFINNRIG